MDAVIIMDGILILDKPEGLSSHDCVNEARRALHTRKVGHSGTLDPEASGVLVLAVNRGTKVLEFLNQDDKVYRFTVRFNLETDTLDHTGVITRRNLNAPIDGLDHALESFKGDYFQTPPAYSAVKVNGRKLYEYARSGEAIPDVPARHIHVHSLTRESDINSVSGTHEATFRVHASKGLYVRKLASDIAVALSTVAHTTMIRRLKAGRFTLEKSISLKALRQGKVALVSMNESVSHIPEVEADEGMLENIRHGRKLDMAHDEPLLRLVSQGRLLAVYHKEDGNTYRAKKVFINGGSP